MTRFDWLLVLAITVAFAMGTASLASFSDSTSWTPDGDCVVNVHHDNRWLWLPDSTTVTRYCEVPE